MTYACPAWEFEAETHPLKLQRLQNRVLRTIGNFPRRALVCDMHVAFQILYVYDYITKSCRQQAEDRPDFSSERALHRDKTATLRQKKKKKL
jgi:hypothetical protein